MDEVENTFWNQLAETGVTPGDPDGARPMGAVARRDAWTRDCEVESPVLASTSCSLIGA